MRDTWLLLGAIVVGLVILARGRPTTTYGPGLAAGDFVRNSALLDAGSAAAQPYGSGYVYQTYCTQHPDDPICVSADYIGTAV